jgi:hypothetical protein
MKKLYLSFALILLFPVLNGHSQTRDIPVSISVFNNATALPPGVLRSLFSAPVHPGVQVGTYFPWNSGERHELFQTLKLGYFYHRYSQHGIQIFSEGGYRYHIGRGFSAGPLIGAGYLHSIPDTQILMQDLPESSEF